MKIAHFGTFDIDNYGDLLFPHICRYRIPDAEWIHISPTNQKTTFDDALQTISVEDANKQKYDLVVIGGGNIIHSKPTSLPAYKAVSDYAYPSLWIGATLLAINQKLSVRYNAPSLHITKFSFIDRLLFKFTFSNASYLSFRDFQSKRIASQLVKSNVSVIPDTASDIAKMWPLENQDKENYIIINLNKRYHQPIKQTALYIDEVSQKINLPIKLCIIGDCHGDLEFTLKVKKQLKCENELFNTKSLKELAH